MPLKQAGIELVDVAVGNDPRELVIRSRYFRQPLNLWLKN
jgi:hypothetical protein